MKLGCAVIGDTHRKPITSITAVLLPILTYLPTLPHIIIRKPGQCIFFTDWGCLYQYQFIINISALSSVNCIFI
jgi:hypothetical protein